MINFRKIGTIFLALIVIAALTNLTLRLNPARALPQLAVSIVTNKSSYSYRDKVEISGSLWLNGEPVDGLVGVQVTNPNGETLITRTASIGISASSGGVEILGVTPCDKDGKPKNTFIREVEDAHVNVTVKNNDIVSHEVLITICTYDNDSSPIIKNMVDSSFRETIPPNGNVSFKPQIPIYAWVSTGLAAFHVNVYTDWPKNGGYPYTAEKSATFRIVPKSLGASASSEHQQFTTSESSGFYNVTFRLPPNAAYGAPFGVYSINVSAYALGYTGYSSKTFSREFQVDGDINFDRNIGILDLVPVTSIYGSQSGDPSWNPTRDVQPSGKIDILDVVIITGKYGQTY
jgi:hypothetical protein